MFYLLSSRSFRKRFVNGKQPRSRLWITFLRSLVPSGSHVVPKMDWAGQERSSSWGVSFGDVTAYGGLRLADLEAPRS